MVLLIRSLHFLIAGTKLRKATVSFVMSLCPHGLTGLPLGRFSLNLILIIFRKSLENIQA